VKIICIGVFAVVAISIFGSNTAVAAETSCFASQDFLTPSRGVVGNGSSLQPISSRTECLALNADASKGQIFGSSDSLAGATTITVCVSSSSKISFLIRASIDGSEYFDDTVLDASNSPFLENVSATGYCVRVTPAPYIRVIPQGAANVTIQLQAIYG
jgi:hypothetical protein